MKKHFTSLLLCAVAVFALTACCGRSEDLIGYVTPLTGTSNSTTESALRFSQGTESLAQTVPIVSIPNAQTMWTPQTRKTEIKCVAPYYYKDSTMQGFRGSHWINGGCAADYGSFTIMPVAGELVCESEERASAFSHDNEVATPSYYSVLLDRYDVQAGMSGLTRAAIFDFRYNDQEKEKYVVVQVNNDRGLGYIEVDPERREIRGYNPVNRQYRMSHLFANLNGYFVVQFDRAFEEWGTFGNREVQPGASSAEAYTDMGAWIRLEGSAVAVKAGTSFTGIDAARANLASEITGWNLAKVRKQATKIWNEHLARIRLEGATEYQKRIFYTAFYHTSHLPRVLSDADGMRPAFSTGEIVPTAWDGIYYDDFSMWDIYRATLPLYEILDTKKTSDFINSYIAKYCEGGWLPIFPLHNNYTSAMIGDHVSAFIGDAYAKGIRDFDVETAYEAMRQNAFEWPGDSTLYRDGKGRRGLRSYLDYGYIPLEDPVLDAFHRGEQVSRTLEYAFDDFVVAQVANALGKTDDYTELMARAGNWRNIIDPETKWGRGRYADGSWVTPFDPTQKLPFITEGTPKHYTWYVPQDIQGLIDVMGGDEPFAAKLDSMFTGNFYWHGNEPGHQTLFMFNWAGQPWKTQEYARNMLRVEYTDGPGGLSGNEDAGQMSAWYIFASMGFYPVCPGVPEYAIASPVYPKVEIALDNGKTFTIIANNVSEENKYIRSATMNGEPYDLSYIRHEDLRAGATFVFEMGPEPGNWATSPASRPYSMTSAE